MDGQNYDSQDRASIARAVITWSWNFDERPRHGIFHWENLMWHSSGFVAGQSEYWSRACGEVTTSKPLGMVLGGMWVNPDIIPSKVPHPIGGFWVFRTPSIIYVDCWATKVFTFQTASRSVQPFLQGSRSLQTDTPYYSVCTMGHS